MKKYLLSFLSFIALAFTSLAQCGTTVIPSVSITADQTIVCQGTAVTFTATPVNGGTAPTYQWSLGNYDINGATNATYIFASYQTSDKLRVTMISNDPCASPVTAASNEIGLVVNPTVTPAIVLTANVGTICLGNEVLFTSGAINGGLHPTFIWKNNGTIIAGETSQNYKTSSLTTPNSITVEMVTSIPCATTTIPVVSAPVSITLVNPTSAGIIGSDQSICYNTIPGAITETSPPTGMSGMQVYTWEASLTGLPGSFTAIPGSTNATYTPSLPITQDMYIRRKVEDPASPAPCNIAISNVVKITVAPMETMTVALNNPGQVCAGTNLNFTVTANISTTGTPGALSYQWYLGTNPVGSNSSSYSYTPQSSDNGKTVKVIVTSSGCNFGPVTSNIVTLDVVSFAAPTVTISTLNNPGCIGAPVTFTATATAAGTSPTYQWYVNSAAASIGTTNSTFTTTSLVNGDQVWVELTSNQGCMIGTNPFKSNIIFMGIASPIPAPMINEGDQSICSPNAFYFTCSSVSNVSYQWKHNGTNIAGATRATYEASQTGNYSVEITNGICSSAESDPVTLTIINTPIANAGQDQYVLAGMEVTLNASGGESYSWTPTQGLNNFLISNPTVVISETIEYMVKVADQSNTCSTIDAVKIYVTNVTPGSFSTFINGLNPILPGLQNISYGVPNQASFSYVWSVTGGTIVSGQNTNSVLVDWDPVPANATARTTASPYSISVTETNQAKQSKKTTLNIQQIATRVTKSFTQAGITLFPNPTAESFSIEMPESGIAVNYEIVDLTGVSVAQGNFISSGTAEKITTDFGAGIYQVILRYNNTVTCGRLSKMQ